MLLHRLKTVVSAPGWNHEALLHFADLFDGSFPFHTLVKPGLRLDCNVRLNDVGKPVTLPSPLEFGDFGQVHRGGTTPITNCIFSFP